MNAHTPHEDAARNAAGPARPPAPPFDTVISDVLAAPATTPSPAPSGLPGGWPEDHLRALRHPDRFQDLYQERGRQGLAPRAVSFAADAGSIPAPAPNQPTRPCGGCGKETLTRVEEPTKADYDALFTTAALFQQTIRRLGAELRIVRRQQKDATKP